MNINPVAWEMIAAWCFDILACQGQRFKISAIFVLDLYYSCLYKSVRVCVWGGCVFVMLLFSQLPINAVIRPIWKETENLVHLTAEIDTK